MSVERDRNAHVFQIGRSLDNLATVVGGIAQLRHVATVFVFHLVLFIQSVRAIAPAWQVLSMGEVPGKQPVSPMNNPSRSGSVTTGAMECAAGN
jgi:hypothetical protein